MSGKSPFPTFLMTALHGGFIQKPETAAKIVEAIVAEMVGEQIMQEERPFRVTDQGDSWKVEGSKQREWKAKDREGVAMIIDPVTFIIRKKDGQIIDYRSEARLKLDPEAERMIREMQQKQDE
jgi:hypothetical protein